MNRKTETIPFLVLGLILLVGLFLSACGSGDDISPEGKTLQEERCTVCYTLS